MKHKKTSVTRYSEANIELRSDNFFADIVSMLAQNLEEVVGLEDSASFVAAVGSQLGAKISAEYSTVANAAEADANVALDIADVCIDLKARVGGHFEVESIKGDRITFVNSRCPFGARVAGKPSLCMMTTNVFGRVAADRNGYATVHIEKAIATGDRGCRVIVSLAAGVNSPGHQFFR